MISAKKPYETSSLEIGDLQDPVTWYGINYTGTQMTQWDFQNKGTLTSPARLSFVLKVPLRHLRPSVIYSVPCDRILQIAYYVCSRYRKVATLSLRFKRLLCLTHNRNDYKQGYETAKCKVCISAVFISYDHRSV